MKRTPLKRGTKQMKRSGFKNKPKTALKRTKLKRRSKTPLAKAKLKLWALLREYTILKYGSTCYTCGKEDLEGSNRHLGHFITKSTCSGELAYSEDNLRIQCYHCNINLSGAWVAYEAHLILDHDRDYCEKLKKRNQETKGKKYDILFYEKRIAEVGELIKKL